VLYLLSWAIPDLTDPVRQYGMLVLALTPAVLVVVKGLWRSRFWQAVALAHLMWGFAQIIWIVEKPASLSVLQDSMYWLFKLFMLTAILYRPFYKGTELHRRLHFLDTVVAISIIAYYIAYFFILPSLMGQTLPTFYSSIANIVLNAGITAAAVVLAWRARQSEWGPTYRMITAGLFLYTVASASDRLSVPYTEFFWCATFWAMALAVNTAVSAEAETVEGSLEPSRYGASMLLIFGTFVFHLGMNAFGGGSHELHDGRIRLTLGEVLVLMALLQYRLRLTVEESELRSHRLSLTLNSLRQPIYIVDGNYNIVLANDVFYQRFKAPGTCYESLFGFSHPCDWCDLPANRAFSRTATIGESIYQLEFSPMTANYGKGGVELLVDVTNERKRQEQLIQTERMASLGRMIAGTAHELNNPLAIVLGNAQLLRDEPRLSSEGREMVRAIASAGERAKDIVHTFLNLSRPRESGKEIVDLVSIIRSVEHLKYAELKSYGIRLELELPEYLPVIGRYTLLQEIFLNLIDNARDAIRQARRTTGCIHISGHNGDGTIQIVLHDNGTGIPAEDLGRVFDPFFTTKEVGKGTGLGLSVTHSIVKDHAGNIRVESDGSSFTRFHMEFPAAAGTNHLRSTAVASSALRILVVDDEPEMLNVLKQSLGRKGHHVECTSTGKRALQLLSKNKFDVLLLDMHLPEMDGKAIVLRLEAMDPPVSVRPIIVTGDSMSTDTAVFAENHRLPIVMKPIDFNRLDKLLQPNAAVH
jgi:signal transduction histidine kinase/CheY-like chemotaxis protein